MIERGSPWKLPALRRGAAAWLLVACTPIIAHDEKPALQPLDVFDLQWVSDPQFSPDARSIAYVRMGFDIKTDKSRGVVWLTGADGRHARPLSSAAMSSSPRWSPDGTRLAYLGAGADGSTQLFVYWTESGVSAAISNFTESPSALAWSPDGRWIAYDRDQLDGSANGAGCCSMTLHLIRPDGSGDHTIAAMRDAAHDAPSPALWAPRGDRFVFSTEARDLDDPALALVDIDSGKVSALAVRSVPLGWSGDGSELAVVRVPASGRPNTLSLIDSAGHGRVLATNLPPSPFAGAWSPRGTKLVISGARVRVHAITAVDLELIDPAGGSPRVIARLPRGSQVESVAWRPVARTR